MSAAWKIPVCSAMTERFRKAASSRFWSPPSIIRSAGKGTFQAVLQDNIATVLNQDNDQYLIGIDKRLEELQTELLKLASSKVDFKDVADEIYRLREEKQKAIAVAEHDEQLVRRLVEKVTVYEDKFAAGFKSGVTVEVEN